VKLVTDCRRPSTTAKDHRAIASQSPHSHPHSGGPPIAQRVTYIVFQRSLSKLIRKDIQQTSSSPAFLTESIISKIIRINLSESILKVIKRIRGNIQKLRIDRFPLFLFPFDMRLSYSFIFPFRFWFFADFCWRKLIENRTHWKLWIPVLGVKKK
jgi:hypothetical protein